MISGVNSVADLVQPCRRALWTRVCAMGCLAVVFVVGLNLWVQAGWASGLADVPGRGHSGSGRVERTDHIITMRGFEFTREGSADRVVFAPDVKEAQVGTMGTAAWLRPKAAPASRWAAGAVFGEPALIPNAPHSTGPPSGTALKIAGTGAGAALLAFGWVALLRRQVAQRTAALRDREERQRAFLDNQPDLAWMKDRAGRYIAVNQAFAREVGLRPEAVVGKRDADFYPAEFAGKYRVDDEAVMQSRETRRFEETFPNRCGHVVSIETVKSPLFNAAGEVIGTVGVGRDISERKRTELALLESEARTRLIIDTALDAVVTMDSEGRITAWNTQAEVIFGRPAAEVLGQTLAEIIIPPEYREAHRRGMARYLATGVGPVLNKRIEITALRRDGTEFPIELAITPLRMGDRTVFSAFVRDITERQQAEAVVRASHEQLRQSEERFQKAFRLSPAMLTLSRLDTGALVEVNDTWVRASGYPREEALGKSARDLGMWAVPLHAQRFLTDLRLHGHVREQEVDLRTRSGLVHTVLVSADTVVINGEPHVLSAAVDITTRKTAETQLQQALARERELVALKSNFVSLVSHEFRTPLEIIMSSGEILHRYFDRLGPEQRRQHLESIHNSVRRMDDMMEEVLVLGRVESGKMEFDPVPFDLHLLSRRVAEEISAATNERNPIRVGFDDAPESAFGDETLLGHILTNLLGNAVKYSPAGQPVDFTVARLEANAVFRIADRGCGIPEADRERLFHAFHRGQNVGQIPGTGLGLVIVKRCVELHRGAVHCESQEGDGTTFTVTVPLFVDPIVATATNLSQSNVPWDRQPPGAAVDGLA